MYIGLPNGPLVLSGTTIIKNLSAIQFDKLLTPKELVPGDIVISLAGLLNNVYLITQVLKVKDCSFCGRYYSGITEFKTLHTFSPDHSPDHYIKFKNAKILYLKP